MTTPVDRRDESAIETDAQRLCADPAGFFDGSWTQLRTIDRDRLTAVQLEGVKQRFRTLRHRIPMLTKLADKQGITSLSSIEDIVPLLFVHTIYKAYPPSLLEQNRFTDINRWLGKLTTVDLTGIDVARCASIDEWLATMDAESPLRICHSSGTSGTMSFLPISDVEWAKWGATLPLVFLHADGPHEHAATDEIHCIYPYFRDGGSYHLRMNDLLVEFISGSEDRFHVAFPGRMSSDVLYLSARLSAARAGGELDRLQLSPSLTNRKVEFEQLQASMPVQLEAFLDQVTEMLSGRRIFLGGTWNLLHGMAARGLAKGLDGVFASNSVIISGGGAKGMTPPANWQDDVQRFTGAESISVHYGMSEVFGTHTGCEHGHYHFAPWVVPFILDPDTSEPLERRGQTTGRAAFFDLGAETRWGGFITGDEITVDWDTPCPCGHTSAYAVGEIRRFSDTRGGDDKITCAATEDAHKAAMDFLSDLR